MNNTQINRDGLIYKIQTKYLYFFVFLFCTIFLFRGPTLFNDYYEADELAAIVQTRDYIAGDIPKVDFHESKNALYHLIFKVSYNISYDYGWVFVHIITIFIVFLTSVFIFFTGEKISNRKTGMLASLFYGILISSFNRNFMATNGEIVYNLFLAAGLFFFIFAINHSVKKILIGSALVVLMGICAYMVKFHGIILFISALFCIFIFLPFRKWGLKNKYFLSIIIFTSFLLIVFIVGYIGGFDFSHLIIGQVLSKLYYASAPGRDFSILDFILRFVQRQSLLTLWHFIIWVPAFIYIYYFLRGQFKKKSLRESAVVIFFIFTYLMVFGGGARLYFHYFMAAYPSLVLVSAFALENIDLKIIKYLNKKIVIFLLIPGIFFLSWNTKDVIIKHFYPNAFYNEGKFLFWTRAVIMGTYNHYLLPGKDYVKAVDYVKESTEKDDRIFVWGDGPYINYFSGRSMGGYSLWMKNRAYHLRNLYNEGGSDSIKKARHFEASLIGFLERKRPELIIDVSENGLSGFEVSLKESKYLYEYVLRKYNYEKSINGIAFYRLKKNKKIL